MRLTLSVIISHFKGAVHLKTHSMWLTIQSPVVDSIH